MGPKEGNNWIELHSRSEIEHLIDNVQTMGFGIKKIHADIEKAERLLVDTVPDIEVYLAGVKFTLERLTSLYYSTSIQLECVLEDIVKHLGE